MHPAYSVIFFTTASGAGYGMLALMGFLGPLGYLPSDPVFCTIGLMLGLALVTAGLLSSTAHLGHPERAWRAFSQWRSSWLSREGVAAVLTYPPALAFGGLSMMAEPGTAHTVAGFLLAGMSVITVLCTAMIYASLPTIRRWSNGFTVPLYLLFMLATGAPLVAIVTIPFGGEAAQAIISIAIAATILVWLVKQAYWGWIQTTAADADATPESATGLGRFGQVRQVEAPHTSANFVMQEMGFAIARRRAKRLKKLAFGFGLVGTIIALAAASSELGSSAVVATLMAMIASAFALLSAGIERWLFFAEAKHVVTLYYGSRTA